MAGPAMGPEHAERGSRGYPAGLLRLGRGAPASVALLGNSALLREPLVALFCSERAPPACVLLALDTARELSRCGAVAVGGFQTAVEKEWLLELLRAGGRAVVCPARSIERMRVPSSWSKAREEGRLLLLSPFPERWRRPTAALCRVRNRLVAALASRILLLHATPGGRLMRVVGEALREGVPVHCPGIAENQDLRMMGALPLELGMRVRPGEPSSAAADKELCPWPRAP